MQLVYILHSGNMYGMERMSLATCEVLKGDYVPTVLAPPGDVHEGCKVRGIESHAFTGMRSLASEIQNILKRHREIVFFFTSLRQALVVKVLNLYYRRKLVLIDVVHGGEPTTTPSFRNKRWYNYLGVHLVAPSNWMVANLLRDGVNPENITMIDNFLTEGQISRTAKRPPFTDPVAKGIMVSRLDPNKQVYLIFEAMALKPALKTLNIKVFGGGDLEKYRALAKASPNVEICGFQPDAAQQMGVSDLFIHTCPSENLALVMLEAYSAGLPIIAPNAAGCAELVEDGVTGFLFTAGSAQSLADCLEKMCALSPSQLNEMVVAGRKRFDTLYSPKQGTSRYRALIERFL